MDTRIKYGIISGLIAIALMGLSYATGIQDNLSYTASEILGFLVMIVSLLVIILAILEVRRKQGGHISFGKALGTGMLVTLIGGVFVGVGIAIMLAAQGDQFFVDLMAKAKEGIESSGLTDAQKQEQLKRMQAMSGSIFVTPWFNGLLMFFNVLVLGFIISLITSLALKRNK